MRTRRPARAPTALPLPASLCLIALMVALLGGGAAHASEVARARRAFEAGDTGRAQRILGAWLEREPTDPDMLLAAARLAGAMEDLQALEAVQAAGEAALDDAPPPRLREALAFAYVQRASLGLARGMAGTSVAFLFADAESQAEALLAEAGHEEAGRVLLALARRAQGDVEGALAVLRRGTSSGPRTLAMRGRLLYERAVAGGLDAAGRPTPVGRADLEAAIEALGPGRGGLPAEEALDARLARAWAAHRLGRVEEAAEAYLAAHATDPRSALALRGLASLLADRPEAHVEALERLAERVPEEPASLEALARARLATGDATGALHALQARIALDRTDPAGWALGGGLFATMGQWREAGEHYARALELTPAVERYGPGPHAPTAADHLAAALEDVARQLWARSVDRGLEAYDELLFLRPADPYVRNNLGFLLREAVAPWTEFGPGQVQTIRADAPDDVHFWLERSVAAYRDAVERIPEEEDDDREDADAWNLAGIVNDYGLMLHYFADVQDPLEAERQYLRAMRMTGDAFQDTYSPNLRRLYGYVMADRELAWLRIARRARDAILAEEADGQGGFTLVPDDAKRAQAEEDVRRLAEGLAAELADLAREDGLPWPPPSPQAR